MGGWRASTCAIVAGAATALALAACGGSGGTTEQNLKVPAHYTVAVDRAHFPSDQNLAGRAHLLIAVRNAGSRTIPNVAVTICNVTCAYPAPAGQGTSAEAFAIASTEANLASQSRPIWIVNRAPGACGANCGQGAEGSSVTANSNTWALGPLAPGKTARFDWVVTPIQAGRHVVAWQVAAGLDGAAKAVLADGSTPQGHFKVNISSEQVHYYVTPDGEVTTTTSGSG